MLVLKLLLLCVCDSVCICVCLCVCMWCVYAVVIRVTMQGGDSSSKFRAGIEIEECLFYFVGSTSKLVTKIRDHLV